MTGQEQGDLLKQVTAWACLTIYIRQKINRIKKKKKKMPQNARRNIVKKKSVCL
jgi:hypothetical protein